MQFESLLQLEHLQREGLCYFTGRNSFEIKMDIPIDG